MYLGRTFVRTLEDALEAAELEGIKVGHVVKFTCEQEPSLNFTGIAKSVSFEFGEVDLCVSFEDENRPRHLIYRESGYLECGPERMLWFYSFKIPDENKTKPIPGMVEF